MILIMIRYW